MFEIIEDDLTPELITKLTPPAQPKYLLYFDPLTYSILSITNEKSTQLSNYIEIDFDKIEPFLLGKKDPSKFKLILNPSNTFEIVSKVVNQDTKSSILVTVPSTDQPASLIIVNNVEHRTWKFLLSEKEQQRLANDIINYSIGIFVTSIHNKNALYRTIDIDLSELVKEGSITVPYQSDIESSDSIQLITVKFFESYSLRYESEV
jgi:hypothetical protein